MYKYVWILEGKFMTVQNNTSALFIKKVTENL